MGAQAPIFFTTLSSANRKPWLRRLQTLQLKSSRAKYQINE
jgi:hypothetical protein